MEQPADGNGWQAEHVRLLIESFRVLLGRDLIDGPHDVTTARRVFHAPFIVLSHDTSADPVLNYGNLAALRLWETDWAGLTSTPSRLTAEPVARAARAELMARTARDGYVSGYTGIRISMSGTRFRISNAIVWNLQDASGTHAGQAATFSRYEFL